MDSKQVMFPNPSGNVVKLQHSKRLKVVKEPQFRNSSGEVVRLTHCDKSIVVKEIELPIPLGNGFKFLHS